MTKVELARRLGVDRMTVTRWENGQNRPERGDVVQQVAELFAIDLDTALAAAGLRPATVTPIRPDPLDPLLVQARELFEDPATPAALKEQIRTTLQTLLDLAEAQLRPPQRRRKVN